MLLLGAKRVEDKSALRSGSKKVCDMQTAGKPKDRETTVDAVHASTTTISRTRRPHRASSYSLMTVLSPPSARLPPIRRIHEHSVDVLESLLKYLRAIYNPPVRGTRRSGRKAVASSDLETACTVMLDAWDADFEGEDKNDSNNKDVYAALTSNPPLFALAAMGSEDELTYREAMAGPEREQWMKAMQEELEHIEKMDTYELVELPGDANVVGTVWARRKKHDENNCVVKYKARLCAQGFSQVYGVDYTQMSSPMARLSSFQLVLALAAANNWEIHQMDFKNAYLNGDLNEMIYMRQPPGFEDPNGPQLVWHLRKALYGLKQAELQWYRKVCALMDKISLTRSNFDPGIFYLLSEGVVIIIIIHVDNCTLVTNSSCLMVAFKAQLATRKISLSQRAYIDTLLVRFCMTDVNPLTIPADSHANLFAYDLTDEEHGTMRQKPYAQLIRSLMYAAIGTRPDIAFIVSTLACFMSDPALIHWEATKHVLHFLKGTRDHSLILGSIPNDLVGYKDADWAPQAHRHLISGFVFLLNGGAISWRSFKQPMIALSSTEAEYITASDAAQEAIWLHSLLAELTSPPSGPTLLEFEGKGRLSAKAGVLGVRERLFIFVGDYLLNLAAMRQPERPARCRQRQRLPCPHETHRHTLSSHSRACRQQHNHPPLLPYHEDGRGHTDEGATSTASPGFVVCPRLASGLRGSVGVQALTHAGCVSGVYAHRLSLSGISLSIVLLVSFHRSHIPPPLINGASVVPFTEAPFCPSFPYHRLVTIIIGVQCSFKQHAGIRGDLKWDLSESSLSTLGDGGNIPTITEAARAIELGGLSFTYGLNYITDIGTLAATVALAISDTVGLLHPTHNVPAMLQEASLITQELAEFEEAFVNYSGQAGKLICIDPCPPIQILGSLDQSPQLEVQNASDPRGGLVQADQVVLDVEASAVSVLTQCTRALPAFRIPMRNVVRLHNHHLHMPSTHCTTTSGTGSAIEANTRALSAVQDPVQPAAAAPKTSDVPDVHAPMDVCTSLNEGLLEYLDDHYAAAATELEELFCVPPPYGIAYREVLHWVRMGSLKNYHHACKHVAISTHYNDLQHANSLAEAEMDMLAVLSALCGSERLPTI
ncbi:hypothetical protein NUW54_g2913 [Trametes sanguinea]|uniref:Uncharacterized protein n=1 Tax=Trametes sanguinea TaxID=158606 RepID=A0ACC1Q3V9_9APHY|nr:hypothetical protein NUW54_g2913 [Trametes sanguinea]